MARVQVRIYQTNHKCSCLNYYIYLYICRSIAITAVATGEHSYSCYTYYLFDLDKHSFFAATLLYKPRQALNLV